MAIVSQDWSSFSANVCFLIYLVPLLALLVNTEDSVMERIKHLEEDNEKLNQRVSVLEVQNSDQEQEIRSLKTEKTLSLKGSTDIDSIMIEPSSSNSENQLNSFQGSSNKIEKNDQSRSPTSCNDLRALGHKLNGIYLVKPENSHPKIEAIYCDFNNINKALSGFQQTSSSTIVDNRLVESISGIYFYVARHGDLPTASNGVIRFNKERLNIGGAMNLLTGVFTAPKAGIYHFSFSLAKEAYSNMMDIFWIYFRLNGNKIGTSIVSPGIMTAHATAQFILKLKKGARVDLWKPSSGAVGKCIGTTEPCNHFTGWLLEENF